MKREDMITEEQYIRILKIQGIPHPKGSVWFHHTLEKINDYLIE
jgi:hypothetical protein